MAQPQGKMKKNKSHFKTRRKTKERTKGSLFLESLIVLNLLLPLTSLGFTLLYLSFAHLWLHHTLYEAILCRSKELSKPKDCKQKLRQDIEKVLTLGTLQKINLKEQRNSFNGQIQWKFLNFSLKKNLFIEKKNLKLSLKIKEGLL